MKVKIEPTPLPYELSLYIEIEDIESVKSDMMKETTPTLHLHWNHMLYF